MFVPVQASSPTKLAKVKSEARFTAVDPWNQGRSSVFTVEDYLPVLRSRDAPVLPESAKPRTTDFNRAIRSDADGITRFLPDSLAELWLTGQVSSEDLPHLLKQIEPILNRSDCEVVLRSRLTTFRIALQWFLCAFALAVAILFLFFIPGLLMPRLIATLIFGGICLVFAFLHIF
jgi:hypothetical protein